MKTSKTASSYTGYYPPPATVDPDYSRSISSISSSYSSNNHHPNSAWSTYPSRRRIPFPRHNNKTSAGDKFLVATRGNALQAMSRTNIDSNNMVAITVPEGARPGDSIMVAMPMNNQEPSQIVPFADLAGQDIHHPILIQGVASLRRDDVSEGVQTERHNNLSLINISRSETPIVTGFDVGVVGNDNYEPYESHEPPARLPIQEDSADIIYDAPQYAPAVIIPNEDLVLVRIPHDVRPGEIVEVQISDGRWLEAPVPECPEGVNEFYIRVPPPRQQQTRKLPPSRYTHPPPPPSQYTRPQPSPPQYARSPSPPPTHAVAVMTVSDNDMVPYSYNRHCFFS